MKITGYKNPQYMAADNSVIDLEVDTDLYGWIPITITPDINDLETADVKQWLVDNISSIAAYVAPLPPPVVVPAAVSMRQARLALLQNNQLTTVQGALDGLAEPQKTAALIEWEYAATVERNGALVQSMIAVLGLTTQQTDDLFILADSL